MAEEKQPEYVAQIASGISTSMASIFQNLATSTQSSVEKEQHLADLAKRQAEWDYERQQRIDQANQALAQYKSGGSSVSLPLLAVSLAGVGILIYALR